MSDWGGLGELAFCRACRLGGSPLSVYGRKSAQREKKSQKTAFFSWVIVQNVRQRLQCVMIMSSIASIESELRNQLSSLPRFSLRGHPLSCYPKSKGDICPSPHDFYTFPSISFVFPMAFVVWEAFPSRSLSWFLTRAYMRAFPAISTFLLSQPSHASYFKLEKSGCCSRLTPVLEISRLRRFSRRDLLIC